MIDNPYCLFQLKSNNQGGIAIPTIDTTKLTGQLSVVQVQIRIKLLKRLGLNVKGFSTSVQGCFLYRKFNEFCTGLQKNDNNISCVRF